MAASGESSGDNQEGGFDIGGVIKAWRSIEKALGLNQWGPNARVHHAILELILETRKGYLDAHPGSDLSPITPAALASTIRKCYRKNKHDEGIKELKTALAPYTVKTNVPPPDDSGVDIAVIASDAPTSYDLGFSGSFFSDNTAGVVLACIAAYFLLFKKR